MTILIGPAGSGLANVEGIKKVKDLGLDAIEIEFTYGVKMSNAKAKEIGEAAKKLKISLSVHGPYYVNLVSAEKPKITASKKRILDSCERGHNLGAKYIVFHAAFYGKHTPEECYDLVKKEILDMQKTIKQKKWNVILCPETTGKPSQFGTVEELAKLAKATGCGVCIDFSHIYARNQGKIDYDDVCKKIKRIRHKTAHFSGIDYGPKGERKHIPTKPAAIKELIKYLKKYKISIRVINESPQPVKDSLVAKKLV